MTITLSMSGIGGRERSCPRPGVMEIGYLMSNLVPCLVTHPLLSHVESSTSSFGLCVAIPSLARKESLERKVRVHYIVLPSDFDSFCLGINFRADSVPFYLLLILMPITQNRLFKTIDSFPDLVTVIAESPCRTCRASL